MQAHWTERQKKLQQWLDVLNHPERAFRTIRIAGTNGKGSVGACVARGLLEEGRGPIGHFSSPHVLDYRERIQIDGQWISTANLAAINRTLEEVAGLPALSYFERSFLQAVLAFQRSGCQMAVMECGVGGRTDATQVLPPAELCLWTSIAYDHEAVLGHSLRAIAENKAEILPPGGCGLSAPQCEEVRRVLEEKAASCHGSLAVCSSEETTRPTWYEVGDVIRQRFAWRGDLYDTALLGLHQVENLGLALAALQTLGVSEAARHRAVEHVRWRGRLERLKKAPALWVDGAHNAQGIDQLLRNLAWLGVQQPLIFFGAHAGKVSEAAQAHLEDFGEVHRFRIDGMSDAEVEAQVQALLRDGESNDEKRPRVLCGSLYTVGAAIRWAESASDSTG